MHPRNRYRDRPPDLETLSSAYPALRDVLSSREQGGETKLVFDPHVDGAIEALVTAMIRVDFGVESYSGVPPGHLVPSVTRSLNYLHYVEDLVAEARRKGVSTQALSNGTIRAAEPRLVQSASAPSHEQFKRRRVRLALDAEEDLTSNALESSTEPKEQVAANGKNESTVKILDVGTGASCVFPILGCALNSNWSFLGLDVDPVVLDIAKSNSAKYSHRIELKLVPLGPRPKMVDHALDLKKDFFDACMCNPPFFAGPFEENMDPEPASSSNLDGAAGFGGTDLERWCEGGEAGFVQGLVAESVKLRNNCIWFTSMLGKKENVSAVLSAIQMSAEPAPATIRLRRLDQGHRIRWVVSWSFIEQLAERHLIGSVFEVTLNESETMEQRRQEAIEQLHNFTPSTGICGGEGFRFRIRVVLQPFDHGHGGYARVDALDMSGPDHEFVEKRARAVMAKVQQLMCRTSRRFRKMAQSHRRGHG